MRDPNETPETLSDDDPFDGLLIECIRLDEVGDRAGLESLLAHNAEHRESLLEHLETLTRLGLRDQEPRPASPPPTFDDFRILRRIGRGGMGEVFLAEERSLGRLVALKIIREASSSSAKAITRFRREGRVAARLEHPNIVRIYSTGEVDGASYIAMEYVRGRTLSDLIADAESAGRPLPIVDVVRWSREIAEALAVAHAAGLVHRDVKSANVMVRDDGRAVLLDFGLARDLDAGELSMTGTFVGSPHYAAPEQIRGDRAAITPLVDVFGLGVMLHEAVTGRLPFEAATREGVFNAILSRDPRPARQLRPEVPRDLEAVIGKALEKDPERRYPDARALANDLGCILELRAVSVRPAGPLRRLVRSLRHRPALSAAIGVGFLAGVSLFALLIIQDVRDRERRLEEFRDDVLEADRLLDDWRRRREAWTLGAARMTELRTAALRRHLARDEERELDRLEDEAQRLDDDREVWFAQVFQLAAHCDRLAPGNADGERLRREVHTERWRLAESAGDSTSAARYRELAESSGGRRDLVSAAPRTGRLEIRSDPPGAEVHAFAYRLLSRLVPAERPRLVPVPIAEGDLPIPIGAPSLRVEREHDGLDVEDLIVSIEGHQPWPALFARRDAGKVARGDVLVSVQGVTTSDDFELHDASDGDGEAAIIVRRRSGDEVESRIDRRELRTLFVEGVRWLTEDDVDVSVYANGCIAHRRVARGGVYRATGAPLVIGARSFIGRAPLVIDAFPKGEWLFLLRNEGSESRRFKASVHEGSGFPLDMRLYPRGTTPPGFRPVVHHAMVSTDVWYQDREVTVGEYLEFLNDPSTLAEIDAASTPIRMPRDRDQSEGRIGFLLRGGDGRFAATEAWPPDRPVGGISHSDATAYAVWYERKLSDSGYSMNVALPEWRLRIVAGSSGDGLSRFVFGSEFRASWVKSCFARVRPAAEPGCSFPFDESPYGLFDVSGSVSEWCRDLFWVERGEPGVAGGAWPHGREERFESGFCGSLPADQCSEFVGLRLSATLRER